MMHDPFLHIEGIRSRRALMRCCCLAGRKTCSPEDCAMSAAGLSRYPRFAILALILMALSASGVLAGLFWICGRMASIASTIAWPV